ncbi:MAG TPA: EVE domain-containing protein [Longimicrobiales bacterium]|nr:EVE domain-containing protein [Longimicrobiales bacterium]
MRYWLMKSEPDVYSIDDLERDGTTHWDGVRNHQAKNFMRDDMAVGDRVLYYHSNAKPPGVAGVAEVVRAGYPDHTAQDPDSKYYDPRATPEAPRWFMVDIAFVEKLPRFVSLEELKGDPALDDMLVTSRSRLSVQPVEEHHFRHVLEMARDS